jgi:aspartokinase-like uncharacterized kinase
MTGPPDEPPPPRQTAVRGYGSRPRRAPDAASRDVHVLKLGGSLLDLPDLPACFDAYRQTQCSDHCVLVVGGGDAADHVRRFDRQHGLGEEAGHWMAVRAMQLNTHMVASILPRCRLVNGITECTVVWRNALLPVVDPLAWLEDEHRRGIAIPHRWSFTSDSIAAHLAHRLQAQRLSLLKSVSPPADADVARAAQLGLVDADFPAASAGIARVELVNLRAEPPARFALK